MMWNLRTLANAYTERPPTQWVVDKFLQRGSLNAFYGAPASLKSMILADMCAAVASGGQWLPNCYGNGAGVTVEQGAVLWVDMDNGTRRSDERFEAVGRARNMAPDAPLYYVSMPVPPLQLHTAYTYRTTDEHGEEVVWTVIDILLAFVTMIRQVGASLVVIDNLGLITGDVDENSAEMASVMGHLRLIAERTNAAIVVIHHQRKGGANGSRAGDALRGHSSIEASLDLAVQIVRESDSPEVMIQSTKTRGVDVPTLRAKFNYEHKLGTNDLRTAWFAGVPGVRGENAVRDALTELLTIHGAMTKTKLAQDAAAMVPDTGINRIRAWIDELLSIGELVEIDAKGRKKVITLP